MRVELHFTVFETHEFRILIDLPAGLIDRNSQRDDKAKSQQEYKQDSAQATRKRIESLSTLVCQSDINPERISILYPLLEPILHLTIFI